MYQQIKILKVDSDFYLAFYLCVYMCTYLPLYMNHMHEVIAKAIQRMGSPETVLKDSFESPDLGARNQTQVLWKSSGSYMLSHFSSVHLLGTKKEPAASCPLISKCMP